MCYQCASTSAHSECSSEPTTAIHKNCSLGLTGFRNYYCVTQTIEQNGTFNTFYLYLHKSSFFLFFSVSIVSCACTIHIHVFPLFLHTLIFLLFDRIGCITSSLHLEFTLYKTQQGHIHSVDPVLQVARAYSTLIQSDNLMLPSFVFLAFIGYLPSTNRLGPGNSVSYTLRTLMEGVSHGCKLNLQLTLYKTQPGLIHPPNDDLGFITPSGVHFATQFHTPSGC